MDIPQMRHELEDLLQQVQAGDTSQVAEKLQQALHRLDEDRLLTTTQAAAYLGIHSVNTLKALVQKLNIPYKKHGNRMLICQGDLQRVLDDPAVRCIRATDRLHQEIADFGAHDGLTDEELQLLSQSRPGRLPWKTDGDEHQK